MPTHMPAADLYYSATQDKEVYKPSAVTTANGSAVITISREEQWAYFQTESGEKYNTNQTYTSGAPDNTMRPAQCTIGWCGLLPMVLTTGTMTCRPNLCRPHLWVEQSLVRGEGQRWLGHVGTASLASLLSKPGPGLLSIPAKHCLQLHRGVRGGAGQAARGLRHQRPVARVRAGGGVG